MKVSLFEVEGILWYRGRKMEDEFSVFVWVVEGRLGLDYGGVGIRCLDGGFFFI